MEDNGQGKVIINNENMKSYFISKKDNLVYFADHCGLLECPMIVYYVYSGLIVYY